VRVISLRIIARIIRLTRLRPGLLTGFVEVSPQRFARRRKPDPTYRRQSG
jgi:hypothetical protein